MTQRLVPHQPVRVTGTLDDAEKQRVFDLLKVQQNIQVIFDELADKLHIDSFLIEGVELTTGSANYVDHLLDRKINGWWVAKRNAEATIWEDESVTVDSTKQLVLQCSANTKIDLVVY